MRLNLAIAAVLLGALALLLLGCVGQQGNDGKQPGQAVDVVGMVPAGEVKVLTVEKGDSVQVDYTGRLENGTVFDTSVEREAREAGLALRPQYEPLEFVAGAGQMIAGFDSAVVGMYEGQNKKVSIPPEDAYGVWSEERVVSIPLESIEGAGSLEVGQMLYTSSGGKGRVLEIANGNAKVDFNHELAGKTLVFDIRLVKITRGSG